MKKYFVNVDEHGTIRWYSDAKRTIMNREDGPAYIGSDGTKIWYINGMLHREGGPGIEHADGSTYWYVNDVRHRVDGPATEFANGHKFWYLYGTPMSEKEHRIATSPAKELTMAEIEKLLGYKVKVVS